jgi:transcription elongation factor S-II
LKSRDLLAAAFSISELPEGSVDPVELAARVEDGKKKYFISNKISPFSLQAIYKEIKDTGVKYRNRIRSRISNLKDTKNPELRVNVLLGLITPERLAVLTAEVCLLVFYIRI